MEECPCNKLRHKIRQWEEAKDDYGIKIHGEAIDSLIRLWKALGKPNYEDHMRDMHVAGKS